MALRLYPGPELACQCCDKLVPFKLHWTEPRDSSGRVHVTQRLLNKLFADVAQALFVRNKSCRFHGEWRTVIQRALRCPKCYANVKVLYWVGLGTTWRPPVCNNCLSNSLYDECGHGELGGSLPVLILSGSCSESIAKVVTQWNDTKGDQVAKE